MGVYDPFFVQRWIFRAKRFFYTMLRRLKKERWPDLSQESVELIEIQSIRAGKPMRSRLQAMFTNFPIQEAIFKGWVRIPDEYYVLADLEYARRFPGQDFSQKVRKRFRFSDEEILAMVRGKLRLVATVKDGRTAYTLAPR